MTPLCFVILFSDFQGKNCEKQPRIEGCPVFFGDLRIPCQICTDYIVLLCSLVRLWPTSLIGLPLIVKWFRWWSAYHGSCQKVVNYLQWIWSEVLPQVQKLNVVLNDFFLGPWGICISLILKIVMTNGFEDNFLFTHPEKTNKLNH